MLGASAGEQQRLLVLVAKQTATTRPRERRQETRSRAERSATCTSTSTLNEPPILRGCGWAGGWRSEDRKRGAGAWKDFLDLD